MLIALHKPFGVLCQFSAAADNGPTLADFIASEAVYPAGRLDKNSEGLLLLTDQGALQHQISHPDSNTPKEYWVQLEHRPNEEFAQALCAGTDLKDGHIGATSARWLGTRNTPSTSSDGPLLGALGPHPGQLAPHREQNSSWYSITLTSGKNRIVRRMCAALGHPVLRLVRVRIGTVELADLAAGESREVRWH